MILFCLWNEDLESLTLFQVCLVEKKVKSYEGKFSAASHNSYTIEVGMDRNPLIYC